MVGYIHLWRELLKKPIWLKSTPEQRSVLIAILLMANFDENEWEWKGEKFKVDPGQFITSLESIRKKSGKGISTQNVRSSLKRFEKLEFLTNKSTKQGRLISIINWPDYQSSKNCSQHSTQQRPNKEATKTQHLSNKERKKEGKNVFKNIVEYLNKKTGKSFKYNSKETKRLIIARINAGFKEEDFFTVIDNKCFKWLTDPKMIEYLRPQTLFGTKFESYLQDTPKTGFQSNPPPTTFAQKKQDESDKISRWALEQRRKNREGENNGTVKLVSSKS